MRYQPLIRFAVTLFVVVGGSTALLAQQPERNAPPAANNAQPPPGGVTRPELFQLSANIFLAPVFPVNKDMEEVLLLLLGWPGIITIVIVLAILLALDVALKRPRPIPERIFRRTPAPARSAPPAAEPALAEVPRLQDARAAESMDDLTERELIDRLGAPVRTFVPSWAVKIVGKILVLMAGLVGVLGGFAVVAHWLGFWTLSEGSEGHILAVIWLVFSASIIGIAVLGSRSLKTRFHPSNRVLVCPGGIIRIERDAIFASRWERIYMARLWDKLFHTPAPNCTTVYQEILTITRDDGLSIEITRTHVCDLDGLFDLIIFYLSSKTDAKRA